METIVINGIEYNLVPKQASEILYNDWRLPTIQELLTLVNYKKVGPACTIKDIESDYYWSSTINADYTNYAWEVCFDYGNTGYSRKKDKLYVRFVRNGVKGLEWTITYPSMTWEKAMRLAESLEDSVYYKGE